MSAQADFEDQTKKESIHSSVETECLLARLIWVSILADTDKTISCNLNFGLWDDRNF